MDEVDTHVAMRLHMRASAALVAKSIAASESNATPPQEPLVSHGRSYTVETVPVANSAAVASGWMRRRWPRMHPETVLVVRSPGTSPAVLSHAADDERFGQDFRNPTDDEVSAFYIDDFTEVVSGLIPDGRAWERLPEIVKVRTALASLNDPTGAQRKISINIWERDLLTVVMSAGGILAISPDVVERFAPRLLRAVVAHEVAHFLINPFDQDLRKEIQRLRHAGQYADARALALKSRTTEHRADLLACALIGNNTDLPEALAWMVHLKALDAASGSYDLQSGDAFDAMVLRGENKYRLEHLSGFADHPNVRQRARVVGISRPHPPENSLAAPIDL